jgi:hypothetical protein
MKHVIAAWAALSGTLLAVTTSSTTSLADTAATASPADPAVAEQTSYAPPNRPILAGGILAFLASYGPAVVVAAANSKSYDNNLYIPLVGPWLDLRSRPGCGGPGEAECTGREEGSRALLVLSGVFQALGAMTVAVGLIVPEKRHSPVRAKADKPALHVFPAQVSRDGYGLAAAGTF